MNTSNEQTIELAILFKETSEEVVNDYYAKFCDALHELGISEHAAPIPPEVWIGLAQAFADTSGYRVILEAAVLKESAEDPNSFHAVGHHEVTTADPTLFLATD